MDRRAGVFGTGRNNLKAVEYNIAQREGDAPLGSGWKNANARGLRGGVRKGKTESIACKRPCGDRGVDGRRKAKI